MGERQIEKVRNLIWLRVSAASRSPSRLPLQMEVNVKQSLLLVSGGINSLERDWAVREVNACLSAQLSPCSNTLYFSECSCCILTLYASSPGHCWSGIVGVYAALPVSFKHCFGVFFAAYWFTVFSCTQFRFMNPDRDTHHNTLHLPLNEAGEN